ELTRTQRIGDSEMNLTINLDRSVQAPTFWTYARTYAEPSEGGQGKAHSFSRWLDEDGYVLDASMVSQTWPLRLNRAAQSWLEANRDRNLYVPAIVLEVIEQGIVAEQYIEPQHAAELELWKRSLP